MSSWSEIRARSGDPLNDTLNDLITRANLNEAVKDDITAADQISPIRVMRSKVTVRDNGMMTGYVRPIDQNSKYFMPLEPDGEKLRLQVRFDSGCDSLTDYSLNQNDVRISFGPFGLPNLIKGTEDDGITAGDMVSQLDGKTHAYRVAVNSRNSIKSMVTQGKGGFGFIFRLFFIKVDNMFKSGNLRRATLLDYIDNDQVTHAIRIEVADDGILYFYIRHASVNYSVKTTTSVLTPPSPPDYATPDYNPEDYDTALPVETVTLPIDYTDLAFVFNFTTHQILIYKDKELMSTTSTGVSIIPSGDPMFPVGFADPPPPPPQPLPYQQPWEKVYEQLSATADVKINKVTVTAQDIFYLVENGIAFNEALMLVYTVPVGVPYTPPPVPPPPEPGTTPMDPLGKIDIDMENPDGFLKLSQGGGNSDYEAVGVYQSPIEQVGLGANMQGKAISKITFYLGCNGTIEGKFYFKVWSDQGNEVANLGYGEASELEEDSIGESTIENINNNVTMANSYIVGVEYTEGGSNDDLYVYIDESDPEPSVETAALQDNEWSIDSDIDVCCDVYGGIPGTGPPGGGGGGGGGSVDTPSGYQLIDQLDTNDTTFTSLTESTIDAIAFVIVDTSSGLGRALNGKKINYFRYFAQGVGSLSGDVEGVIWDDNDDEVFRNEVPFDSSRYQTDAFYPHFFSSTRDDDLPEMEEGFKIGFEWTDPSGGSSKINVQRSNTNVDPSVAIATRSASSGNWTTDTAHDMKAQFFEFVDTLNLKLIGETSSGEEGDKSRGVDNSGIDIIPKKVSVNKISKEEFAQIKRNRRKKINPMSRPEFKPLEAIIKRGPDLSSRQAKRRLQRTQEHLERLQLNCDNNKQSNVLLPKTNNRKVLTSRILGVAPTPTSTIDLGGIDDQPNSTNFSTLQQISGANEIVTLQVVDTTTGLGAALNTKVVTAVVMNLSGANTPAGQATCKMWDGSGNVLTTFGTVTASNLSQGGVVDLVVFENVNNTIPVTSGCRIGLEYKGGTSSDQILVQRNTTVTDPSVIQSHLNYGGNWGTNTSRQPRIHFWTKTGTGGGGGTGGSTEPPGRRGAVAPNGVISCYGTGEYSEDYEEDYHSSSDSMRWDFAGLGASRFAWGEELTGYCRSDNPPEDELTGIMGGGTHGDEPHCYNVGIDTITGETRYRMEEEHPDNIDGEDGGEGEPLGDKWIGYRWIKWNQPDGVRLEIWQDTGNNEGSTPANQWKLVSSWIESEFNWQDPPDDHQISMRVDDSPASDTVEVKWLGIREILPSDTEAGTGGGTGGPPVDPTIQYPNNPLTNLLSGSSTMGERFDAGAMIGKVPTLCEFQAYRDPAVTTGTVSIIHMNGAFVPIAVLATYPVTSLPTTAPSVNTFNLVWQDPYYHVPISPGDSIVVQVNNVLQGVVYVMDNVGNWDGVKNYFNNLAYKVFNVNTTGTFYQRPDIDLAGRISIGGGVFYPYMQLDNNRKRVGTKAVKVDSELIGRPVTKVFVNARSVNNPTVDLIYCRVRSSTGDLKATIGQIDSSIIPPATDTPLEFINTQNEVVTMLGDTISIEYDKGTATDYIMISINKGYLPVVEEQRTMLFESTITNINQTFEWFGYDLAALIATGGKIDTAARPMRGVRLKAGSALIGKAISEVRVRLQAVGLFGLNNTIRVKIIRGVDKVTMAVMGQLDATSLSTDLSIEYPFQNTNNYYKMVAGDMIGVEFNFGDSTNFHVLLKTSSADLYDGQNTVMFESNGRIYTDVPNVDMTGEMFIGGFVVVPDPIAPPVIPPFHYAHEWAIGGALPADSGALIDPTTLTLKTNSFCNIVLKEFRLYSIILSQSQIENYYENRFTITPIPFGAVEIVSHDIVPFA